jgi:hypothetical protein
MDWLVVQASHTLTHFAAGAVYKKASAGRASNELIQGPFGEGLCAFWGGWLFAFLF